jgi:excisionase family DNA binding protein
MPRDGTPTELRGRLALRPKEAAEALGISERTLRDWMRNEGLPYAHVGNVVLIPSAALVDWLRSQVAERHGTDKLLEEILETVHIKGFGAKG